MRNPESLDLDIVLTNVREIVIDAAFDVILPSKGPILGRCV